MRYLIAYIFTIFSGLSFAGDKSLPPIGKRNYLIEIQKPASPVLIRPKEQSESFDKGGVALMRDPIPLGSRAARPQPQVISKKKLAEPPKQVSKIVFDKMAVKGRYSVPRVSFDRPRIEVQRRDEPVILDHKKRLRESEAALRAYEW